MHIALIGVTGNAGSRILDEALRRGHAVTALVRQPAKVAARPQLTVRAADVTDEQSLRAGLDGAAVLIAAYTPMRGAPDYRHQVLTGYRVMLTTAKAAHARLIVVGGAGSLKVPDGSGLLVDQPNFPAEYKTEASAYRDVLELLKQDATADWTYVSPSALFMPGERTGRFRVADDRLLADASGRSQISMEDFAIALLDEVERPTHRRRQMTVGY